MSGFMKKPCVHCPYKKSVRPFLHPERGAELAFLAHRPYSSFTCHKTLDHNDEGESIITKSSQECAGFLTLKASVAGERYVPDGFLPSYDEVYESAFEMADAYSRADA